MRLEDFSNKIGSWMLARKFGNGRLIYENEDILVTHNIATFSDGSGEAILQPILKKHGRLWLGVAGATPLPPKE